MLVILVRVDVESAMAVEEVKFVMGSKEGMSVERGNVDAREKLLERLRGEVVLPESGNNTLNVEYYRKLHHERVGPNGEEVGEFKLPRVTFDIERMLSEEK